MTDLFSKPVDEIKYEDLEELSQTRPIENERLDWKKDLTSSRITETVAAMVNTDGGLILLGVAEKQDTKGRTKGMDWPPRHGVKASVQDALIGMCHAAFRPPDYLPRYHLVEIPHLKDRYILVIRVDQRLAPRYLWHLDKGFLTRVGDANRPSSPDAVRILLAPSQETEQDQLYDEWRLITPGADGVLQHLIVVLRYPHGARVFGSEQKKILQRAVAAQFSYGNPISVNMDPKHGSVSFERNFGGPDEKLMAWFSSLGVARITLAVQSGNAIKCGWIMGEAMLALECLRSDDLRSVYPNVREGDLTLALTNWPPNGIDTDNLAPPPRDTRRSMTGQSVQSRSTVDSTTSSWTIVRAFLEQILADAGCMDYEMHLDAFGQGVTHWLPEYRRATNRIN